MNLREAVGAYRNAMGAVLRIHPRAPDSVDLAINGSAWCIAENRYFVTAYHVLAGGGPLDPTDRYFLFVTPDNGPRAYHFPVVGIPFTAPAYDLAVLEVGPPADPDIAVQSVPVTTRPILDGTRVLTLGFPAPAIASANVDTNHNWMGGEVFLKSHANEGIVASQYEIGDVLTYELNVGWHHGESGGPIIAVDDEPAAFSVMQHYRNIETPLGTVAGPHMGRSLHCIEAALRDHGAKLV